jgi:hypothetical protein
VRDPDLTKLNGVSKGSLPTIGIVRKLEKGETQIRQYQTDGNLRWEELLFSVSRNLDRFESMKDYVIGMNKWIGNNPSVASSSEITGITYFLKKHKFITETPTVPPPPPKKKKNKKKKGGDKASATSADS